LIYIFLCTFWSGYVLFAHVFGKHGYISPLSKRVLSGQDSTTAIEEGLKKYKIPFNRVTSASQSAYIIFLASGEEVTVTSKKSLDIQLSSLQLILSRLTIEGKRVFGLDLRFDKPIMVSN